MSALRRCESWVEKIEREIDLLVFLSLIITVFTCLEDGADAACQKSDETKFTFRSMIRLIEF